MKLILKGLFVASLIFNSNNLFSQGIYGILGYRMIELQSPLSLNYISSGFDDDRRIESASLNKKSYVLGVGVQFIKKYKRYWGKVNPIYNFYFNLDFNSFKYEGYDYYYYTKETISNIDWSLGFGYGFRFSNAFSISTNLEYTFTGVDDWDLKLPSENYFALNIKLGFGKETSFGHLGLYGTYYPQRHFINKSGSEITCYEITLEIPIDIYALMIEAAAETYGADDYYSSPSFSGPKGCHVYGKIKFVDYGENYKVKFVNYGENLKIKYVNFGANSSGRWQVVDYGEDFRIKVVDYGEDFKVKEVSFGEGCR